MTDFVGEGPRFLTIAKKVPVAAFECDGDVYMMSLGQKPHKITLTATVDDKTVQEERLILNSGVTHASLSPKGDQIAFSVRGKIWTVPTKKGKGPNADDATQLTDWAGLDRALLLWDPGREVHVLSERPIRSAVSIQDGRRHEEGGRGQFGG